MMQHTETYYQVEITNERLSLRCRTSEHDNVDEAFEAVRAFVGRQPDTVARVVRVQVVRTEISVDVRPAPLPTEVGVPPTLREDTT